ncbi:tRNA (adenosine(37)-N6)-dimethylallyltransferase MiaA [Polaromonas sp. JS666]|uniref:tRNA dimethylallyltransferase n=1 Tax=Polaromonas sp. (strain JS666 / ATCC BAA-500) TaxID=296591 RepID=MIAA_POLSJ|nr:tRNA (adenosine(37)-N6)-dimethylallyltransferase MiaA [Polaromonas sp. JS666]Q128B6.1 RecName: Full=tRNA dimethylallyltransferase; AltName: Full=Dimethylallyl diphosphate:tRNA dimethylallyltransferase; Short=DMAPP:tRNA dimethylallyltransferase; Short=DMATase; AltName: Full=Isopentenyl-diphosphate:tRNA isopentenyltransferase; Short=IPP transferase; Short=IPPT; Short=IPTase [Polaromonas sp. JS666]ABE45126.1 tRNA delta(2)-isopentenylpyrophosphate transferase [Polaromonas sp. JS666]
MNEVKSVGAKYIALTGPTASGKTAAAMAIAQQHDVEIISVDSALVYRGMDIGTAKPTVDELAAVPHHLINIRDPLQAYSAAEFVADAQRLIDDIAARGKLPLLVGGTMLYFKALFYGLDDMPKADPAVRAELASEAAAKGWPALHAELATVDPVTAARLAPHDSQRISRALEVFRVSGQPLSFFHQQNAAKTIADDGREERTEILISLEPQERSWLHHRIAERFDAMLAAGFVEEVKTLRARGDLTPDLPSMRCVGYRQAWELLDAQEARSPGGSFPMDELRDKGIIATRQLAKRQVTWLRSMPQRQIITCDTDQALPLVLQAVAQHIEKSSR